jgi:hypothetical protein
MADANLNTVSMTPRETPTPPERAMLKALGEIVVSIEHGEPQQALATATQALKMYAPLLAGIQNDGPPQSWPVVTYADLTPEDKDAHGRHMGVLAAIAARKP